MKRWFLGLFLSLLLLLPAGAESPRYVALTFDDGPSGRFTSRLLDGLSERGLHATFFLCGYRIEQYPELTRRIAAEGHEIGLHGMTHCFFNELSCAALEQELLKTASLIEAQGGCADLLRPPGGIYDLNRAIFNYPIILWSVDPEDWRVTDAQQITEHILQKVEPGDIILMHDMSDSSVDAALAVIDDLSAKGYSFVTVSELAALSDTELTPGTVYHSFRFSQ